MSDNLEKLVNAPKTIYLSGEEFKLRIPSIKDLAEAKQYAKDLKKKKRKEALQERLDLNSIIPINMDSHEKKELLDSYLPKETTPQERLNILNSLPATLSEEDKIKQLIIILAEKDDSDWSEVIYLLWLCIKKCQPDITLQKIEESVCVQDLEVVLEALKSSKESDKENSEKN